MPVINNLAATTELEAVNTMLAAIGEDALAAGTDLSLETGADVVMAINTLRNVTRQVQSMGWRFNTEFGYEVAPGDTYDWVDSEGVTTPLNIFFPPAGLISFTIALTIDQQGSKYVDTVQRRSRKYVNVDEDAVMVFYDRAGARDGFPQADRDFLYINPVWLVDFEDMPETARIYCAVRAARQFVQNAVGSDTLKKFTEQDESYALRNLKKEQGQQDDYNMLDNLDVSRARGRRPGGGSGVYDLRKNRNTV